MGAAASQEGRGPEGRGPDLASMLGARQIQETPRESAAMRDLEFSVLSKLQHEQDSRLQTVEEVKQLLESERAHQTQQFQEMCKQLLQGNESTLDAQSKMLREVATALREAKAGSETLRSTFEQVLVQQGSQNQQLQQLQARQGEVVDEWERQLAEQSAALAVPQGRRAPAAAAKPAEAPAAVQRGHLEPLEEEEFEVRLAAPLARLESKVEQLQRMMKDILRMRMQSLQSKIKAENNHVSESYEETESDENDHTPQVRSRAPKSSVSSDAISSRRLSSPAQRGHEGTEDPLSSVQSRVGMSIRAMASPKDSSSTASRMTSHLFERAADTADWFEIQRRSGRLQNYAFECIVAALILGNVAYIGFVADWYMRNPGRPQPAVLLYVDIFFFAAFTAELLVRMKSQRLVKFLFGPDALWHMGDTVLLVVSAMEILAASHGFGWLRALRALKVARFTRAMTSFKDLRLVTDCMIGSFKSLLWCSALVIFTLYISSLIFMHGFADVVDDLHRELEVGQPPQDRRRLGGSFDEMPTEELLGFVQDRYGSVTKAMLRLWSSSTGGMDWSDEYDLIQLCGQPYSLLFIAFIAFMLLVVWNVVTSTIVEKALRSAEPDIHQLVVEKRRRDDDDMKALCTRFEENGIKLTDKISKDDFLELMQSTELADFLQDRGIDIEDARTFLDLIAEEEGAAPMNFITTCLRVKGFATSMDVHTTHHELMKVLMHQQKALQKCQLTLQRMAAAVRAR